MEKLEKIKKPEKRTADDVRTEIKEINKNIEDLFDDPIFEKYNELRKKLKESRDAKEYYKIEKQIEELKLEKSMQLKSKATEEDVRYFLNTLTQEKKNGIKSLIFYEKN